jgi:alkanesulfonate monooxygenase SsuD/methylene tetrahydromethanopterin reductase-like flavin-dependent oxidoreductase (luciferase family)
MRKLSDYTLLKFEQGKFEPMGSAEELDNYEFSEEEKIRIKNNRGRIVSGTPPQVKQQLETLAEEFGTDEIIITTMTYSQADRMRSFELLAKEFALN